jgi:hypothetical protein
MTHAELCIAACRWLKAHDRAKHAFAEFQSMSLQEFPDAIGFPAGAWRGPTVIEAKVSVADFRADKNKGWRYREGAGHEHSCGMGAHRYYLVPEGMIGVDDVPDDHGLLFATMRRGRVYVPKKPAKQAPQRVKRDVASELSVLGTALQRWELGIPWIADEFRFETAAETKRRTSPEQRRAA